MILQPTTSRFATVADLYKRFGAMPLDRIRFNPWPGTATEEDVVAIHDHEDRLCELVDGVLVEKLLIPHATPARFATVADLYRRFGSIPLNRIRFHPWPGTATEADAVELNEKGEVRCELVDGTLLEKPVGNYESYLAIELAAIVRDFVRQKGSGIVLGSDSMFRLFGGKMRMPDVSFVSRQRMAGYDIKREPVAPFGPDLAVEVISRSNTEQEMDEKLDDYFAHDVRLVWYVYPASEEVHSYTARHDFTVKRKADVLDGGDVLPSFKLSLSELFELPRYD